MYSMCVRTYAFCRASESRILCVFKSVCVCVSELRKKKSQRKTVREREFAGMLYIRSLPLQFKQSRLCWQPPLPSPNGLHHV